MTHIEQRFYGTCTKRIYCGRLTWLKKGLTTLTLKQR